MKSVTCHQTSCRVEVITFHNLCQAEKYLHLFNCALVFLDNIFTNNKDRNGVLVTQGLITNKKIPTKLVLISGAELPSMSGNTENNISTMHKQAITEHAVRAFTMEAGIPVPRQKMKRLERKQRSNTLCGRAITPTQTLTKQSGLLCCSAQSSTSSVMAKGCGCALLGSAWKISPSSNWACAKPPVTPAIRSQPATRGPRHSNGVTPEKTTDDRCQWRF